MPNNFLNIDYTLHYFLIGFSSGCFHQNQTDIFIVLGDRAEKSEVRRGKKNGRTKDDRGDSNFND